MLFQILSKTKAQRESYKIQIPSIIISITDPDKDRAHFASNPKIIGICRVSFDDADSHNKTDEEILMSVDDAKKIRSFIDRYRDRVDQIIVHCEAGQSRSAGVMAAIIEYLTGDKHAVFGDPRYRPNMHCYRLMMNEFFGPIAGGSDNV